MQSQARKPSNLDRTHSKATPKHHAQVCLLAMLVALWGPSTWTQAQNPGQFGGVRVNGIELQVDVPVRQIPAEALVHDRVATTPSGAMASSVRVPASNARTDAATRVVTTVPRVGTTPVSTVPATTAPRVPSTPANTSSSAGAATPAPRTRTLYTNNTLFSQQSLCAPAHDPALRRAADQALRAILMARINEKLPSNLGVHSASNHQLGSTCTAHAEIVGNRITVHLSIPRNRVFVQIMNTGGIGKVLSREEFDPNFFTHYDLAVRATFILPTTTSGRITQESIHYRTTNIDRPQSRSVTGNITLAMNDLIGFLGGPDFVAQLRRDQFGSSGSLVSINFQDLTRQLAGITPAGMRIDTTHRNAMVVMHATQSAPAPGPIVR